MFVSEKKKFLFLNMAFDFQKNRALKTSSVPDCFCFEPVLDAFISLQYQIESKQLIGSFQIVCIKKIYMN